MNSSDDKTLMIPDDVAITLIVFIGLFLIVLLVGTILYILFREWLKAKRDEDAT
jgi:hypothetical protein